jgi:chromate transporter
MEDEVISKRKWLTRSHFLDLIGATNLIPVPNFTEMAIHIGYRLLGLLIAAVCFILPTVLLKACLTWIYVEFGSTTQIAPFMNRNTFFCHQTSSTTDASSS